MFLHELKFHNACVPVPAVHMIVGPVDVPATGLAFEIIDDVPSG